jgi:hypothetical protein
MVIYIILVFYGVLIISRLGCHFLVAFEYMGGVYKHQLGLLTIEIDLVQIFCVMCIPCLFGETWRMEPPGKPERRWNCSIKMDVQEMLWWGTCNGLLSQG